MPLRSATVALLLAFLSIGTAVARSPQIPSPSTAVRNVRKSFLVQSVDLLFPNGRRSLDPGYRLSQKESGSIEKELNHILGDLAKAHGQFESDLSAALGRTLSRDIQPTFQLDQEEVPVARVERNESRSSAGAIHVSLSILRMNLVLADHFALKEPTDLPAAYAALLREREEYRSLKGGTSLGEAVRTVRGKDDDRWERDIDALESSQDLERSYSGALLFVLAHEMGHIALGHLADQTQSPRSCADNVAAPRFQTTIFGVSSTRAKQELEADFYAALLTARLFNETDTINDVKFTHVSLDSQVFLEKGLRLAGFDTGSSCDYPAMEARRGAVILGLNTGIAAASSPLTQRSFDKETAANQALELTNTVWRSGGRVPNEVELASNSSDLAALSILLDPDYEGGYLAYGRALILMRNKELAREMFAKAVELSPPEERENLRNLSKVFLSVVLDSDGHFVQSN